jgi:hypothetical protein
MRAAEPARWPALLSVLVFLFAPAVVPRAQAPTADAVLGQARAALGGEQRLGAVQSLIVTGRTRQVRGDNLVPIEFEIQVEWPDKYSRRDEIPAQDTDPATNGFNGAALVQMPVPPTPPARPGGPPPPTPEQQAAARQARVLTLKQDVARLMLGMLAASPLDYPVTFTYVGQAQAPQGTADVLDVRGMPAFMTRMFIDSATHLPIMLTWLGPAAPGRGGPGRAAGPPPAAAAPPGPAPEQRLFFADYREVDGLRLPFRIRRAVGADTTEETIIDRYRINARTDPRRFAPVN